MFRADARCHLGEMTLPGMVYRQIRGFRFSETGRHMVYREALDGLVNKQITGSSETMCQSERPTKKATTMKTVNGIKLALAFALLASGIHHLSAQTFPVTVNFKMQQQDFSTFVNGIYTDKVKTSRFGNAELLTLLSRAYATNFPNGFPFGASLVLVDYSYFQVQSSSGAILITNVSDFLTYTDTFVFDEFLYQGKEDTISGLLNYVYLYQSTIQFNDGLSNPTSFIFTGNTTERYSRTKPDQLGMRLYSGGLMINGMGYGFLGGTNYFLLSGRFSTPVVKWMSP
jgi:hypothetical protein